MKERYGIIFWCGNERGYYSYHHGQFKTGVIDM